MTKNIKIGLLPRILIAIALGIGLGLVLPLPAVRIFVTFNSIFSHFLQFLINTSNFTWRKKEEEIDNVEPVAEVSE